jgi:hypothetical protein
MPIVESDISGIRAVYTALIAAARSSLSPADAGAFVRRLRDEKVMVMRTAKDRKKASRANRRKPGQPIATKGVSNYFKIKLG